MPEQVAQREAVEAFACEGAREGVPLVVEPEAAIDVGKRFGGLEVALDRALAVRPSVARQEDVLAYPLRERHMSSAARTRGTIGRNTGPLVLRIIKRSRPAADRHCST